MARRRPWKLPAVIAVGVALVGGAVGGGIALGSSHRSSSTPTTLASGNGNQFASGTTTPTTTPTTTSPPTPAPTGGTITQDQVDAAVLVPSDLSPATTTPVDAGLCGSFRRPARSKVVGYNLYSKESSGDELSLGQILNAVLAYPDAASAKQAFSAIPGTIPGCAERTLGTSVPDLQVAQGGQTYCDQTYIGYIQGLHGSVPGLSDDLFASIVRCNSTLDVMEYIVPNLPALQDPLPDVPDTIEAIVGRTADKLGNALS